MKTISVALSDAADTIGSYAVDVDDATDAVAMVAAMDAASLAQAVRADVTVPTPGGVAAGDVMDVVDLEFTGSIAAGVVVSVRGQTDEAAVALLSLASEIETWGRASDGGTLTLVSASYRRDVTGAGVLIAGAARAAATSEDEWHQEHGAAIRGLI